MDSPSTLSSESTSHSISRRVRWRGEWGLDWLLIPLLAGFGLTIIIQQFLVQIVGSGSTVKLIVSPLLDLSLLGMGLWTVWGKTTPKELGYRKVRFPGVLGWLLLGLISYLLLSGLYIALTGLDHSRVHQPINRIVHPQQGWLTWYLIPILTLVAPLCEEFFFRGFLWTVLRRNFPSWVALVGTALLFGLGHVGSYLLLDLPLLVIAGLVLGMIRWATRSLLPGMLFHATINSVGAGEALHLSLTTTVRLWVASLLAIWLIYRLILRKASGRSLSPVSS